MPRGKGVKPQSYREGGLKEAMAFGGEEGAAWIDSGGRNRVYHRNICDGVLVFVGSYQYRL
jgi:hypothetical protein